MALNSRFVTKNETKQYISGKRQASGNERYPEGTHQSEDKKNVFHHPAEYDRSPDRRCFGSGPRSYVVDAGSSNLRSVDGADHDGRERSDFRKG